MRAHSPGTRGLRGTQRGARKPPSHMKRWQRFSTGAEGTSRTGSGRISLWDRGGDRLTGGGKNTTETWVRGERGADVKKLREKGGGDKERRNGNLGGYFQYGLIAAQKPGVKVIKNTVRVHTIYLRKTDIILAV